MFRVGLVLVKFSLEGHENLAQCASFFETVEKLKLRSLPPVLRDEEFLISEVRGHLVVLCDILV